jgi:hypothetical protein
VLSSASDVGVYDPQPGGITSTPATQDVRQLASVTPFHGGHVKSSRVEQDETVAAIGTLQIPSERAASNRGKKTKKKVASAASSVASAQSEMFTPRSKRTRGDTKLLAAGKQLEPKVSKKLGKRALSPGSGTSRGRGGTDGGNGAVDSTRTHPRQTHGTSHDIDGKRSQSPTNSLTLHKLTLDKRMEHIVS